MKKILVIALLFISALATKADDYYDIPAGWEKVIENIDSVNVVGYGLMVEDNIILAVYKNIWLISKDYGKTFEPLKFKISGSNSFIYKKKICSFTSNGFKFHIQDIETGDSKEIEVAPPITGNLKNVYVNPLDSTIIITIENVNSSSTGSKTYNVCFISNDGGINWTLMRNLHKTPLNYNVYQFIFDTKKAGKWAYSVTDGIDDSFYSPERTTNYMTEDNGKTFVQIPTTALYLAPTIMGYSQNDTMSKFLSFDFENSVRNTAYFKDKNNTSANRNGYYVCDAIKSSNENLNNFLDMYIKTLNLDTNNANKISIEKELINYNNLLLISTLDNFKKTKKENDSSYVKVAQYNITNHNFEVILKRSTYRDTTYKLEAKDFNLLFIDLKSQYLYAALREPKVSVSRILYIKRKLFDPTSVEEELPIGNHFQSTHIELFDILGRSIATFTSYEKLKAEIENYPPPHLIKWRDEKGISHFERMK